MADRESRQRQEDRELLEAILRQLNKPNIEEIYRKLPPQRAKTNLEKVTDFTWRTKARIEDFVQPFIKLIDTKLNSLDQKLTRVTRRSYPLTVITSVPLLYCLHVCCLLLPSSQYQGVQSLMTVVQYMCSLLLFPLLVYATRLPFRTLFYIALDIAAAACMEATYMMFKGQSDGRNRDTEMLGTNVFVLVLAQLLYVWYISERFHIREKTGDWWAGLLCIPFIPLVLCFTGILTSFMAGIYYWLTKTVNVFCLFTFMIPISERIAPDSNALLALANSRYIRDVMAVFGIAFLGNIIIFDVIDQLFTDGAVDCLILIDLACESCTSPVIIMAVGWSFSLLANMLVLAGRVLLSGQHRREFREAAFSGSVGVTVFCCAVFFSLESEILLSEPDVRTYYTKLLFLFCFTQVMNETWNFTAPHIYRLENGIDKWRFFVHLRVFSFITAVSVIPTLLIYWASLYMDIQLWLLLNASGCTLLISKSAVSVVEYCLVSLSWTSEDNLDKIEDAIYYVRVFKTLVTMLFVTLQGFYRLLLPNSRRFWVLIVKAVTLSLGLLVVSALVVYKEWLTFRSRRNYVRRVNRLQDASDDQLQQHNDVCAVCYADISQGKVLSCGHIFHAVCLRRWFQIKTTCPVCSRDALSENNN